MGRSKNPETLRKQAQAFEDEAYRLSDKSWAKRMKAEQKANKLVAQAQELREKAVGVRVTGSKRTQMFKKSDALFDRADALNNTAYREWDKLNRTTIARKFAAADARIKAAYEIEQAQKAEQARTGPSSTDEDDSDSSPCGCGSSVFGDIDDANDDAEDGFGF